jgi:hypothetical protein
LRRRRQAAGADASKAILRVASAARSYCALIEGVANAERDGFLRAAEELLLSLSHEVVLLADVDPVTPGLMPRVPHAIRLTPARPRGRPAG